MSLRGCRALLVIGLAIAAPVAAQPPTSVWSGVYTTAQAARGQDLYYRVCVDCHGDDLEGRERAPALAGSPFAQRWDGATLKKLFEQMEEMPPDDPTARLAPDAYADILAFVLSANRMPAGANPLVADKDVLAAIKYLSQKPRLE